MTLKVTMTGPWNAAKQFHRTAEVAMVMRHKSILKSEAEEAANRIRECIETEGASVGIQWEPLSTWTHFEKGTNTKLKDTGALLNSIVVRKKGVKYEVGVSDTATYPDGKQILPIADTLEFGALVYVEMTRRMAGYLALRAKELGIPASKSSKTPIGGTMIIRIPARPFMQPVKAKFFTPFAIHKRVIGKLMTPFIRAFTKMSKGVR